jgi:lysine 6-dehydrogenase
MKVALLGCGAMGRGAAYALCADGTADELLLVDCDAARLEALEAWLKPWVGRSKVRAVVLDLESHSALHELLASVDVLALALPWEPTKRVFLASLAVQRPAVSITRPVYGDRDEMASWPNIENGQIVFPCGLEPGLTEILAVSAVSMLSDVRALRIRCGGLAVAAEPPLYYRLLFDAHLPLTQRDAYAIENGALTTVRRFQGLEELVVEGVGAVECHHDGMVPWLIEDPAIAGIPSVTQKTVRWPGFTRCVNMLSEMRLLSEEPVNVAGVMCKPRDMVEAVLAPLTRARKGDADLTVIRVEAEGLDHDRREAQVRMDLIDRYDENTGLTSMARTTGFTLASVTGMLGRGEITERGLCMPQQVMNGDRRARLFADLRGHGIEITTTRF